MSKPSDQEISQSDIGDRVVHLVESLGRIDLDNLHAEMEETGVMCLWWGDFSARARRHANNLKFNAEITQARVAQEKRQLLVKRGERVTEDQVKELVKLDPEYQAAYRAYLQAEENADKIESAKFTIARKQDTMQALAPLLFQEEGARRPPSLPLPNLNQTQQRTPMRPRGGGS